jgi:Holliday junction DNA helicase RuvA
MIAYIEGKIYKKFSDRVIVLVAGIGYEVFVSFQTYCILPETGENVSFFTYHNIKEDRNELFGFVSEYEKKIFEKLISIGGIGPKTALGIMSPHSVVELENAILEENISFLVKIPGIGKKTAQRIVLELKDKLKKLEKGGEIREVKPDKHNELKEDAILALVNLGYKKQTVEKVVEKIFKQNPDSDFETILKFAFEQLS